MVDKERKYLDLLIILFLYIVSFLASYFITALFPLSSLILKVFVWDVISTIFIFIFSIIFKNSSVYDAYWSVVPPIVAIYLTIVNEAYSPLQILTLVLILLWAVRLTINWISVTSGFSYEDWRYKMFRDKSRNRFEWFIYNFFGIHLVPTIFVFLAMLPMFDIFSSNLNMFSIVGIFIMFVGVLLEFFSDIDMHRFLKITKEKKVCDYRLWNYSRHPNYLGEITFWLGLFVVMILSNQTHFYFMVGFLGMIFMFNIISIPMMEKRQILRRSDYKKYIVTTHRLLLLPHKKIK